MESASASGPARGTRPLGAILAGGASRRFGSPKALAVVGGVPLWERAARALEASTAAIVLITNDPASLGRSGLPLEGDAYPGLGPLAGVHTALLAAQDAGMSGSMILACDLPLVPPSLVRVLVDRFIAAGATRAVVPESGGPLGVEPLCACYPVGALGEVVRRLEGARVPGSLHMGDLVQALDPERLAREELSQIVKAAGFENPDIVFLNVNRPEDARRAEAALRAGPAAPGGPAAGRGSDVRGVP